jgi:NADPH-dependent 2,4-dienoyl-CoA reductase/sulfur reductase-like enzyme
VIGASFIGLEAAAALRTRGLEVHVIAPEPVPFEKVLGAEVGRWVQGVHEQKGVVFHLGRKVQGYAGGVLSLDDGGSVKADIVVLGAGVKPRVALAEGAALKVDNGVVVDDRLRAAEHIYAVGDIARYPAPISGRLVRVEHWVHAERQGQHVARVILGEDAPFTDIPFFWSAHYDASLRYDGHAEGFDPPRVEGSLAERDALVRYAKDGELLAIATLGRDLASLEGEAAFEA